MHKPEEWEIRCDLAAAYRLIPHFGMDDLICSHLSARLPGKDHRIFLNPYGLMFDEITASSLVVVDADGHAMTMEDEWKINDAGFTIHSAVHMNRDDAHCFMHTHTLAGMAVAAQEQGLLPLNQMSMVFYGGMAYHDCDRLALDLDETAGPQPRRQRRDDPEEPRFTHRRTHNRRSVPQYVLYGAVLPDPDRRITRRAKNHSAVPRNCRSRGVAVPPDR